MLKKEFYDLRLRSFVILAIGVGLFFVLAPFQEITVEMLKQYSEAQNMPKFLEKFIPKTFVENLNDWNFYIFSQWFGKNLGQIVPIIAIIMAFPLFARESENRTIEFLVTRRSRNEVFFSKSLLGLSILLIQMTIFSLLPAVYSLFVKESLNYDQLWGFSVHTLVGATFWFTVSLLFSVLSNDQVKPILMSIGLLAISTALGVVKALRFFNTYAYVLGSKVFQTGGVDLRYTTGLLILSTVLFFLSYDLFLRKEF